MTDTDDNNGTLKMEEEEGDSPTCPHCNKMFKKIYRLTRHIYKFHIKPTCTECSNSFTRMKELKEHAMDSHQVKMNKLCSICKKAYCTRRDLEEHLTEAHEQENPLICMKCPRMFTNEERLKAHALTHKRSGSIQCADCAMTFSAPFKLTRHRRAAHTEGKSLQCPDCGEHFQVDEKIRKLICELHSKTEGGKKEKEFACKYCEKPFISPRDVNFHIKKEHADMRPFKCDNCTFIFETEDELERHTLRRHSPRKFRCDECPRRFAQERALKKHLSIYHGVKDVEDQDQDRVKGEDKARGEGDKQGKAPLAVNGVDQEATEVNHA